MRPGTIDRDCGDNSAHNFYDSDAAVMAAMAAVAEWINNGAAPVNISSRRRHSSNAQRQTNRSESSSR